MVRYPSLQKKEDVGSSMHEELPEEVSTSNLDEEVSEDADNFFEDDENIDGYENNIITIAVSTTSTTK